MTREEYIERQREDRILRVVVRLWGRPGAGDVSEVAKRITDRRHSRDMRRRERLGAYARGDR
jgi:hypothetical protein